MKISIKLTALLFTVLLVSASLFSCANNTPPDSKIWEDVTCVDVWNGAATDKFSAGSGSENDPFIIQNGKQLAYFASQVNTGNSFEGKYIRLDCDIDLNNLEWIPIGMNERPFSGVFDGNGHTITNLKISSGVPYTFALKNTFYDATATGFFGVCSNATLKNLTLEDAHIDVSFMGTGTRNNVFAGVLCAVAQATDSMEICNVKIIDAKAVDCSANVSLGAWSFGAIAGLLRSDENGECKISCVQTNTEVIFSNDMGGACNANGVVAYIYLTGDPIISIDNSASHTVVHSHVYNPYIRSGAVGTVRTQYGTQAKLSFNHVFSNSYVHPQFRENGVSEFSIVNATDLANLSWMSFDMNDCYGCVEWFSHDLQELKKSTRLWYTFNKALPQSERVSYLATNCAVSQSLPESHGFDENIWDLSDLSNPKLK